MTVIVLLAISARAIYAAQMSNPATQQHRIVIMKYVNSKSK